MAQVDERAPLLHEHGDHDDEYDNSRQRTWRQVLEDPSKLSTLEKILAALIIFLVCLVAIGFGLFAGETAKYRHEKNRPLPDVTSTVTAHPTQTATPSVPLPTSTKPPSRNNEVCVTPECVLVASGILETIDESFDPCENFYRFVNNGWLRANPIPAESGFFGTAQGIDRSNRQILSDILEPEAIDAPAHISSSSEWEKADESNLKSLRQYYSTCLNEDEQDRRGSKPILELVNNLTSIWREPSSPRQERLTAAVAFLHARAVPALFSTGADGDASEDPDIVRLGLQQDGLGLPDGDYYKDKETVDMYREVIKSSLDDIDSIQDNSDYAGIAKGVLQFEIAMSKISLPGTDTSDPAKMYNHYDSKGLAKLAPYIDWNDFFASYSPRQPMYPVLVNAPSYFDDLADLLDNTSEKVLEGYFVWCIVRNYAMHLGPSQGLRKEVTFMNNFIAGVEEGVQARRSDVCLKSIVENKGFLIGRYYVQRAFSGDSKAKAEDVLQATIQAFKDRLPELDWLDPKTREAAAEKADNINARIAFATSPNVSDPISLQRYYAPSAPVEGHHFENVLKSKMVVEGRKWLSVGAKRDHGVWDMSPQEVNAYYNPSANEISFPAGILQDPYFSKDYPDYLAFGSFGCLAGHELSHAFDSAGRQYDKTGHLHNWWDKETSARFDNLTQCVKDQYAKYYVVGPKGEKVHVNSEMTIGEDVADAGGIFQAFRAWQDRFNSDPLGKKYDNYLLPGLNYTREQLFFIQYARGWARNIKPQEAVHKIRTDVHSPTNFRIQGPLSNDPNFAKAFGCKVGQPMRNEKVCQVW